MHTAICDELGIEFPIFAFTHCRDVVVAVSKAGGFGVLGAVGFTPEQLEIELNWIDEHIGDHHYGVDIVVPNKYEGMDSNLSAEELTKTLRSMVPVTSSGATSQAAPAASSSTPSTSLLTRSTGPKRCSSARMTRTIKTRRD